MTFLSTPVIEGPPAKGVGVWITIRQIAEVIMSHDRKDQIVADGRRRAYDASIDRVRAEVAKEFAPELAKAGFWRRILLRFRMEHEVERRMRRTAPPWGLYLHSFRPFHDDRGKGRGAVHSLSVEHGVRYRIAFKVGPGARLFLRNVVGRRATRD